jgi:hypothetical protein
MKRVILATAFVALLGSAGVSWSADYEKGATAYESGDYSLYLQRFDILYKEAGDGIC